jgi:hypothetical protein
VVVGGPGGIAAPGDVAAFSTAFGRLARRWLWWLLLAHFGITGVEVSGHLVGIYPFAWILTPLLLGR